MASTEEIPFSSLIMTNVSNFVSTKLKQSNFKLWKAQIICLLECHDLVGFVDETIPVADCEIDGGSTDQAEKQGDITGGTMTAADGEPDDGSTDLREKQADTTGGTRTAEYMRWKRSDRLVKGWILGSLSEEMLRHVVDKDTARDVWVALEELCDPESRVKRAESIESKKDYCLYLPLYRASLCGDWESANEFLNQENEACRAQINSLLQTALHVAVGVKNDKGKHFIEKLVPNMTNEDLAIRDCLGDTPLHYAARFGNLHAAKILVAGNPDLPHIACKNGLYPIHHAAEYGYISVDVFAYLLSVTTDPQNNLYTGLSGIRLLYRLIHSDLYDFARELVEKNPDLANYDSNERSALKELAMKEFAFLSGSRLNYWQQLLYYCVPIRSTSKGCPKRPNANDMENVVQIEKAKSSWLPSICQRVYFRTALKKWDALLFDVLEKLVPPLKHIRNRKTTHYSAVKFAECLCEKIEGMNEEEIDSIVSRPLLEAARYGTFELVEVIVRRFPSLAYYYDRNQKNIFHIAIENRCENVFNLVYQMSQHRHQLMISIDSSGNTMLHLAGQLAPQNKLNLVSGPALQMQRELQWFKEVKKFVPTSYWEFLNHKDKPPHVVFTESHAKLKEEGEKWMKDTSNSCTISAALIATIAFAAAITVPGGNDSGSGLPIFSKNVAFSIFAISNAASLFTSSTSLLVFLSVLTSRYAEEDFLRALPRSLILGLLTLFLSITFMMVSFSATVYLVFGRKKAWVLVPVATMACLPITSFVLLQFPLLVAVISSTYGRGIFGKRSGRPFY